MKRSDGVAKERIARNEIKKMSTRDRQLKELDALERLLDVYGADRTRWLGFGFSIVEKVQRLG